MKNNKEWFQLIGLKIASIILTSITLGIPKLIKKIDIKIEIIVDRIELTKKLKN